MFCNDCGKQLREGAHFCPSCGREAGVILLFVWSFCGSVNLNKKNFTRASLILGAIGLILSIVFGAALSSIIRELLGGMGGHY